MLARAAVLKAPPLQGRGRGWGEVSPRRSPAALPHPNPSPEGEGLESALHRQLSDEFFWSIDLPASAPAAPPSRVPARRLRPPVITLPNNPPSAPPTTSPVEPSLRLQ